MNGNPPVPASPGGRSDAPTVIGAGCAQILLPGEGKRPTIALITPSIWGMSVEPLIESPATPTAEPRNSMTAAVRRFSWRTWRGFGIDGNL
jgi:hypothetical protein